jgi:hypothetical protein
MGSGLIYCRLTDGRATSRVEAFGSRVELITLPSLSAPSNYEKLIEAVAADAQRRDKQ